MQELQAVLGELAPELGVERTRLVSLCGRLTNNWDVAEDLAQETLLEAWRLRDKLRNADGLTPWLAAIARHICRRYMHSRAQALAREVRSPSSEDNTEESAREFLEELPASDDGPALLLERSEMAGLLDRALVLVPIETRRALVACYIHELPQVEVAARLRMSEGALRVRLHRGKLALRQALITELREEAEAIGVATVAIGEANAWNETRIWCPFCGLHRLACRLDRHTGVYAFRCAVPCLPHGDIVGSGRNPELLATLTSPKAILARMCMNLSVAYRQVMARGLAHDSEVCPNCGGSIVVRRWSPHPSSTSDGLSVSSAGRDCVHGISYVCAGCGLNGGASAWHLALDTSMALSFWRRHPRMRALPIHELTFDGQPALLTGFESCDGNTRLELISARDTHKVLLAKADGER